MNWFSKVKQFLVEVRAEMAKVTFPSREEVVGTTIVVIITSFIFGIYLWLADAVILQAYEGIFKVFGL